MSLPKDFIGFRFPTTTTNLDILDFYLCTCTPGGENNENREDVGKEASDTVSVSHSTSVSVKGRFLQLMTV